MSAARFAALAMLLALASPACVAFDRAGARRNFDMWMRSDLTPFVQDGAVLTLSGRQASDKVRLGAGCSGSQAQFDVWIVIAADSGHVFDVVTNGIPNNGSLVTNVRYVETCADDSGRIWRKYSIDLEKV